MPGCNVQTHNADDPRPTLVFTRANINAHPAPVCAQTKNAIDALSELVYINISKFRGYAEMNTLGEWG